MYGSDRFGTPLIASLALLPLLAATPGLSQTNEGYADRWGSFVILVWQYRTPPPGPEAKAAY